MVPPNALPPSADSSPPSAPRQGGDEGGFCALLPSPAHLVPDLAGVTRLPYYWGDLNRLQSEAVLQGCADGTFLLRNSSLEGCSFSVTFRRSGISHHIRVQHRDRHFTFHWGSFRAPSVPALLQHYNDPKFCTFFEPLLSRPHARRFPLSLQELCRAALNASLTYDSIEHLPLPRAMKKYLWRCHYK